MIGKMDKSEGRQARAGKVGVRDRETKERPTKPPKPTHLVKNYDRCG